MDVAARFGAEVVAPVAAELDARPNPEDCFSWKIVNVLGEVGRGFEVLATFFPASNAYAAASVLGVASAAYDRSIEWTSRDASVARERGYQPRLRVIAGKPVGLRRTRRK
jgi:hypothetical protein